MKRSASKHAVIAALIAAVLVPAGCAFEDGQPWATAHFEMATEFDDAGRLNDGRYRTSKDYEVQLDEVSVLIGAFGVTAGAAETPDFDPANPPDGYSLCHNGHCHSDDGRLVDYEDIAAELGGSIAGAQITSTIDAQLHPTLGDTAVGDCGDACDLPRGSVTQSGAVVRVITIRGTAWDTREASRIPAEGLAFDWEVPLETTLSAPLSTEIGKDFGGDIDVDGTLVVSARMLDAIDFESGLDEAAFEAEFLENSVFEVTLNEGEVR